MTFWIRACCFLLVLGAISCRQQEAPAARYVGSTTCQQCHQGEYQAWLGSDHDKAMDKATEETVLGDFSDVTFRSHTGAPTRFFRDGDRFLVETHGADGELAVFEVSYVFGHDPLQQYLIKFPQGRMQCLTVAWDVEGKRWYDLYEGQSIPPGDWLHWTGRAQTWNTMCAECHSTNLQKGYDMEADRYHTTWSEIDVACEACHGPGSNHVAWSKLSKGKQAKDPTLGLTCQPKQYTPGEHVRSCAPCHSRRQMFADIHPGTRPVADFAPQLLNEGVYYPDGQVLGENYVYGSFIQSKMFHNDVSCKDCHDPHSLKLKYEGNKLCAQCHDPVQYDTPKHHFHGDNAGSQCVSCHMPESVYMGIDWRADHSIRIPRPDLTAASGAPDACSRCHSDKPLAFSVEAFVRWYGKDKPEHYGTTLAAAHRGEASAMAELRALVANRDAAELVRATALEELQRYGSPEALQAIDSFHRDASPLLRRTATLATQNVEVLIRQLADPVLGVRIAAIPGLAAAHQDLTETQQQRFAEVRKEYIRAASYTGDMPGSQLNLANVAAALGEMDVAEKHLLRALRLDEKFVPAAMNLATLLNAQRRNGEARALLERVVRLEPSFGEAAFSLGLLLAEMQQYPEAYSYLSRSCLLMPEHPRAHYNAAQLGAFLGKHGEASQFFIQAARLQPSDPQVLRALVDYHRQQGQAELLNELATGGDDALAEAIRRLINL